VEKKLRKLIVNILLSYNDKLMAYFLEDHMAAKNTRGNRHEYSTL